MRHHIVLAQDKAIAAKSPQLPVSITQHRKAAPVIEAVNCLHLPVGLPSHGNPRKLKMGIYRGPSPSAPPHARLRLIRVKM